MDLQKPKKSRPDTHDQDDSPEYRINGFGSAGVMEHDEIDHRQDLDHDVVRRETQHDTSPTTSSSPGLPQRLITLPLRHRISSQISVTRIPKGIPLSVQQKTRLRYADLTPPVTKETLSELDLERIMQNVQLRMDANFESGLHFLLDVSGEKGRQKKVLADEYWEALSIEVMIYFWVNTNRPKTNDVETFQVQDLAALMKNAGIFQPRLPLMFETLHGILLILVPEKDHPAVSEHIDVPHLMQQVRKGVLDLVSLSKWLASLLKMHCAPMRDHLADEMAEEIGNGSTHCDVGTLIGGLRKLFSILEIMKLDVANHQLGAYQIVLIENTIPFLRDYYSRLILANNYKADESKAWYLSLQQRMPQSLKETTNGSFYPLSTLIYGLCEFLVLPNQRVSLPKTFELDLARLERLHSEVQKIINVHICWSILEASLRGVGGKRSYNSKYGNFVTRILALMEEEEDSEKESLKLNSHLPNSSGIAMEIARTVCVTTGQVEDVSDSILAMVEDAVVKSFARDSTQLQLIRNCVHQQLFQATCEAAQRYVNMTPLEICDSQRRQAWLQSSSADFSFIATKVAHIGVLHWRIWASLIYIAQAPIIS